MIRTPRLQPVLRAVALVCLIAAAGLDLCAQLDVRVVRVTTNEAVPFANIAWGVPGSEAKVMATDKEGRARVPCPIDGKGIVIRVSCIGFADHTDTLRTCAPVVVRIQPQALALDPVVVTGQYGPTTADQAVHRVRVIGAEQIRRTAAANLADLMRQELNMSVAQDNVLGSSMDVQGLGGENVKVLVDGVPMIGRLNGDIDLSRVDLSGVERVEIIEGPMSVSYGTNALAGTINLITRRRPKAPTSLGISMQGEHIGRLNTSVTGGRSFGKSDLQLTVGHNFFGGWDPQQGGDLYDPTARVADTSRYQQWKPREQNFGRIGYEWHANERWTIRYKGEAMTDRITARGLPRAPYYESAFDERYRTNALDNMLFVEGGVGRAGSLKAHGALAADVDAAAIRLVRAGDDLDERGFARAVLPEQRMHLARAQVERHALERAHRAERFGDGRELEKRSAHNFDEAPYEFPARACQQIHCMRG